MKISNIVVGESYRHKEHPHYCFAKVVEVLRPKQGCNTTTKVLVKCLYSQNEDANFGLVKYFSPTDLIPAKRMKHD